MSRLYTRRLLNLVDEGVLNKDNLIRDLLSYMSEAEVADFSIRNEYLSYDEEDDDE